MLDIDVQDGVGLGLVGECVDVVVRVVVAYKEDGSLACILSKKIAFQGWACNGCNRLRGDVHQSIPQLPVHKYGEAYPFRVDVRVVAQPHRWRIVLVAPVGVVDRQHTHVQEVGVRTKARLPYRATASVDEHHVHTLHLSRREVIAAVVLRVVHVVGVVGGRAVGRLAVEVGRGRWGVAYEVPLRLAVRFGLTTLAVIEGVVQAAVVPQLVGDNAAV